MRVKLLKNLKKKIYCMLNRYRIEIKKEKRYLIKNKFETMDMLLKGYSISRFGDGEFSLIYRKDKNGIKFQDYDNEMRERLKEVLVSEVKKHIVGIPSTFSEIKNLRKEEQIFWSKYYLKNIKYIAPFLKKEKVYYDAMISRFYMPYLEKKDCSEILKKFRLLFNNKKVIIIEGENTRFALGNDLLKETKKISRIICPAKNAYRIYNKILEEVKKFSKDNLILIALGPTATILAYDLAKFGYQALDIGHLDIEYEWYLRNAENKIDIENKAVNEVSGIIDKTIEDKELKEIYESQIIEKLN